jgi:hypothetical protein
MLSHSIRLALLRGIGTCFVVLSMMLSPAYAQGTARSGQMKPGCPFRALTEKVQSIFGKYDRAMTNSGLIEGAEIPNVAKVRDATMYTCVFQRQASMESLEIIANVYPSETEAASAFSESSHVKNASGPYYTSSRQVGKMQLFEGPGRSLSHVGDQVVIIHWQAFKGGKLVPVDRPGSVLMPIAQVWFGPLLK